MGKPSLKLNPLEKTAINTLTLEEYKEILRVFYCGGWMSTGAEKTEPSEEYFRFAERMEELEELGLKESDMCVQVGNLYDIREQLIHLGDRHFYKKDLSYKIITPQEFYKIENINPSKIKEINDFFDKNEQKKIVNVGKESKIKTTESIETNFINPWEIEIPEIREKNEI